MERPNVTGILIFDTLAGAAAAVASISSAMGLTGSTFLYAVPSALADGRCFIPTPTDRTWLAGVSGYTEASGTGLVATGEASRPVTLVECLALRDRFTDAEMGAVTVAASRALDQGDPRLQMLLDTMGAAIQLDLTDPRVQQGIGGLVVLGLLTADRANVILAPLGLLPQPGVA